MQLPIRWVFCGSSPYAWSAKYLLSGPQSAGPQNTHGRLTHLGTSMAAGAVHHKGTRLLAVDVCLWKSNLRNFTLLRMYFPDVIFRKSHLFEIVHSAECNNLIPPELETVGSGKKRIGGCADLRMLRQDKGWD